MTGAAPSKAQSFLEALPVVSNIVGLKWPKEALESGRVRGAAREMADLKGEGSEAPPLTVASVKSH